MRDGPLPPHDVEAERALIGSMLLTRAAVDVGLDLSPDDYYDERFRLAHRAIARLAAEGAPVDPVSVGIAMGDLDQAVVPAEGWSGWCRAVQAEAPASVNAGHYARLVAETATLRRTISYADDLRTAAYGRDLDKTAALVTGYEDRVRPPAPVLPLLDLDDYIDLAARDDEDPQKPWVIPALLRARETAIVTGGEGWGKATLLRQICVAVSCGVHPFTGLAAGVDGRLRTLIIDCQEDEIDLAHELVVLRRKAGDLYERGWLKGVNLPRGVNLLTRRDFRLVEGLLDEHRPALFVAGPIVRMFSGDRRSRFDEDLVDEFTDRLDDLRVRYDCAIILEGHVGNDRGDNAESWRPRGSSVWRSWPFFGLGMAPVRAGEGVRLVDLKVWRGPRHAGRPWPRQLRGGRGWPWTPDDKSFAAICRALGQDWLIDGDQPDLMDAAEDP